jgi:hypothetical protein
MKKRFLILAIAALFCGRTLAQNKPAPSPSPAPREQQPRAVAPSQSSRFDLKEYGVTIQPDKRLIVMMAALEAAGFDPTPKGEPPSAFRQRVRTDLANMDPALRQRLHDFFERNRLKATGDRTPTAADEAARYISLALALGPVPELESPVRSEDLPPELLDVLDFAPLVREFYRRSGLEQKLDDYYKAYQAEGDNLREQTAALVRYTLSYLHTRPITIALERVPATAPSTGKKKNPEKKYTTREHERHFYLIPDLLAVPGAVNFRGIGDDYYVTVPFRTDPRSSELRRAYLQYVVDPLIGRSSKEIAARRDQIKALLNQQAQAGATTPSADVFLAVSRSLVAAADARMDETARLDLLMSISRGRMDKAKDAAEREGIVKDMNTVRAAVSDEAIAQLAEAYERGAVLSFFFADQLKGAETSGFDIASSLGDMIASIDPVREGNRLKENAQARERALAGRKARQAQLARTFGEASESSLSSSRLALINGLNEVDELLRLKSYTDAENRLRALMQEYQGEPRIFFALGQAASLSAQDAFDENVQEERLGRALINYRNAVRAASPDTDKALISRAHAAMGRIYVFLEKPEDAIREFDAAIALGRIKDGAYSDAVAEKSKLTPPKP